MLGEPPAEVFAGKMKCRERRRRALGRRTGEDAALSPCTVNGTSPCTVPVDLANMLKKPFRTSSCRKYLGGPGAAPPASPSEFHALLALDPRPERMLHQRHLGDEVGDLDQFLFCIAPRQDNMRHRRLFRLQEPNHLIDRQVVIAERNVDLVEQDHAVPLIADQLLRLLPALPCGGDVAGLVLRFPGEALAHGVELAEVAKVALDQSPLAGIPGALDELDHG